jgi:hypothetical protein
MPIIHYSSKKPYESKTHPGVTVTLKKCSAKRRDKLQLDLAELDAKVRELQQGLGKYEGKADAELSAEEMAHLEGVLRDLQPLRRQIDFVYVAWGVDKIDGLVIDDAPATAESIAEAGWEDLFAEVVAECRKLTGLDAEERKNSPSPTTSGTSVDGATQNTNVIPASEPADTSSVIAPVTSPTT